MEALVIHPTTAEQLKAVKAFLKALNVRFEQKEELPLHVKAGIKEGLEQHQAGSSIGLEEFKRRHFQSE